MTTMNRAAALLTASLSLAGCGMMFHQQPNSTAIQLNYSLTNAGATGLIQAFDMDGNTVLHIVDAEQRKPGVYDMTGKSLQYKTMGQYVVLNGTFSLLRIQANGAISEVNRKEAVPVAAAPPKPNLPQHASAGPVNQAAQFPPQYGVPSASPSRIQSPAPIYAEPRMLQPPEPQVPASASRATEDEAHSNQELRSIRKELEDLKGMLAKYQTSPVAKGKPTATHSEVTVVSVSFKFNSTSFEPPPNMQQALREYAPLADQISIRGYTDSTLYSQPNLAIATSRAQSARRFLVKTGADDTKIATSAQANGGFIADNATPEGRAQNRRVEIEMTLPAKYAAQFGQSMVAIAKVQGIGG